MLALRGRLPDVEGALVRGVLKRMVERMRPAKGAPWDTYAHRAPTCSVDLCKNYSDAMLGPLRSHITFQVPPDGPAEVDGIPIVESTLAARLDDATVTTIAVQDGQLYGAVSTPTMCPPRRTASS